MKPQETIELFICNWNDKLFIDSEDDKFAISVMELSGQPSKQHSGISTEKLTIDPYKSYYQAQTSPSIVVAKLFTKEAFEEFEKEEDKMLEALNKGGFPHNYYNPVIQINIDGQFALFYGTIEDYLKKDISDFYKDAKSLMSGIEKNPDARDEYNGARAFGHMIFLVNHYDRLKYIQRKLHQYLDGQQKTEGGQKNFTHLLLNNRIYL